ncbi:MAG: hypothetical protein PHW69_05890 [Elusimicrobiaceae bacterium]|nr:hypothetical protein [Elusimicrobiaceae bacterium]
MNGKTALAFMVVLLALPVRAGAQSVSFQVEKATRAAVLAQPLEIPMEIMHATGFEVRLDSSSLTEEGDFEIQSVKTSANTMLADNLVKESVTLTVVPFTLGETQLPPLSWKAVDGVGNSANFTSPPLPMTVAPVIKTDLNKGKIFDIVGPVKPFNWLLLLLVLLLAAAAGWYIRRRLKKKNLPPGAEQKKDMRPLEVRINEEIDRLVGSGVWEAGRTREFYEDLAGIARKYIDARYGMDTTKLTTYELLRLLGRKDLDKLVVTAVRRFMSSCDLVKFAKVSPDTAARDKDVAVLRAVIEDTTPRPKPGSEDEVLVIPDEDAEFADVAEALRRKTAGKPARPGPGGGR